MFALVLGSLFHVSAIDFSDDRGVTVSAMFGISHSHSSNFNENYYGLVASPRIGYRFNPAWEAGALIRYERYGNYDKYLGAGIYGEWSFFRSAHGLRLITEAHASFSIHGHDGFDGPSSKHMKEVGFTPSIAYRIGNSPVELKLRYLFVGFNHSDRDYKSEAPGCLGRGDWIVDASLRRLEIGASITF